jgi:hypothetical protein
MIGIFLGLQNEGKTLAMSYFAKWYYIKGYEIYSNYNLDFPHKKLTKKIIIDYTMDRHQFKKTIFVIDEIYLFFDSRSFGNKANKIFSYFLLQTSKNNVNLYGTAQFLNTVEKRFRENLTFRCFCNRVYLNPITKQYENIENNLRILPEYIVNNMYIRLNFLTKAHNIFNDAIKLTTYYLKAKSLFNIYDTTELINISED